MEKQRVKNIDIIVNPFSGIFKKNNLRKFLEQYLDTSKYRYNMHKTQYAGHAISLAQRCAKNNAYMVVAVGGDGTINEVANGLNGSSTILAIIPGGSGNGYAEGIGLTRDIKDSIHVLNTGRIIPVDLGKINDRLFVNIAGLGFSAVVSHGVNNEKLRGRMGYTKVILKNIFSYNEKTYTILMDCEKMVIKTFILEFALGSTYGYNFVLAPYVNLSDGVLDLVYLEHKPKWRYLLSLWRIFNGSMHKSSLYKSIKFKNMTISTSEKVFSHVDGSGLDPRDLYEIKILPKAINLLVPQDYGKKK